jgi:enoyl-CoA hydratase/carnithine racemase
MADVAIRREGAVLVLELARPEKKNALTGAMYEALIAAFEEAERDEGIGALLITGSGGQFTAGNDIADFLSFAAGPGELPALRFIRALARQETPLVAAVDGVAIGVGTTMLLHCDLAFAAPGAAFRMPFVDLGLVPEAGASLLLPARVGLAKASEFLLLGEPFTAEEAERLGLINAVVATDSLVDHALDRASRLAAKPREALRAARRLLRGDRQALLAAIEAEAKAFGEALASPEAKAAFAAFLSRAKVAS